MLDELLQGQSNRQIGRNLFISEDTVKSHVKAILRKLGARDRAHAVSLVLSNRSPAAPAGHGLVAAELPATDPVESPRSDPAHPLRHAGPASSGGRPVVRSGGRVSRRRGRPGAS